MQATTTLPVIQKDQVLPVSGDYEVLLEQGLELISQYSGALWTNYNQADPGITILQSLCYALTELSYKAGLPIEDLLTDAQGNIHYKNAFEKPWQILPTNPVTQIDFKKIVVDEESVVKQIYFNNLGQESLLNTLTPYVEIAPNYLTSYYSTEYRKNLIIKIQSILNQKSNVGQQFLRPVILRPFQVVVQGEIHLSAHTSAEKVIANLIFQVNQYFSPYPTFYSYASLIESGWKQEEIFDGPFLRNGFIKEEDFPTKRTEIKQADLGVFISMQDGIEAVKDFSIHNETIHLEGNYLLPIPFDVAPYVDLESFSSRIEFVQHGKVLTHLSETKVDYELKKLLPKRTANTDLDKYLPNGSYRDVRAYYSIQYQFPAIYKLAKTSYTKLKSSLEAAKIKQLKAYLVLMEQIMADYLAQLSKIGSLFSFESGRNVYQLAGKTYFFQDLYEVPGIQELLADVKGSAKIYNDRTEAEDWKAYKRDHLNTYRQRLISAGESQQVNLDRKSRVLQHLLARFGECYSSDYLHQNNPGYGKGETAAVQHISETLKTYSLYSANRGRAYFHHLGPHTFVSGYELSCGNKLNLNQYFAGVIDFIKESFDHKPAETLLIIAYNDHEKKLLFGKPTSHQLPQLSNGSIGVFQQERLLLIFQNEDSIVHPISAKKAKELLHPYWHTLHQLIRQTLGFVFIDNLKILSFLHFQVKILDKEHTPLFTSDVITFNAWQQLLQLIRSDLPLDIIPENGTYTIELSTSLNWTYTIFTHIKTEALAQQIKKRLIAFRNHDTDAVQHFVYGDDWEKSPKLLDTSRFENNTTALLPDWVHLLRENTYRSFLYKTLMLNLEVPLRSDIHFLQLADMNELLSNYQTWMKGYRKSLDGQPISSESREAAWNIFELLNRLS